MALQVCRDDAAPQELLSEVQRVRTALLQLLDNKLTKEAPPWLDVHNKRPQRTPKIIHHPPPPPDQAGGPPPGGTGIEYRLAVYLKQLSELQASRQASTPEDAAPHPDLDPEEVEPRPYHEAGVTRSERKRALHVTPQVTDSIELGVTALLQHALPPGTSSRGSPGSSADVGSPVAYVQGTGGGRAAHRTTSAPPAAEQGAKYVLDATGSSLLLVGTGSGGPTSRAIVRGPSYRERVAEAENSQLEAEIAAIQEDPVAEQLAVARSSASASQPGGAGDVEAELRDSMSPPGGSDSSGPSAYGTPRGSSLTPHDQGGSSQHSSPDIKLLNCRPPPIRCPSPAQPLDAAPNPSMAAQQQQQQQHAIVMPVLAAQPGGAEVADMHAAAMLGPLAKKAGLLSGVQPYGAKPGAGQLLLLPDAMFPTAGRDQLGPLQRAMTRKTVAAGAAGMVAGAATAGTVMSPPAAAAVGAAGAAAAGLVAAAAAVPSGLSTSIAAMGVGALVGTLGVAGTSARPGAAAAALRPEATWSGSSAASSMAGAVIRTTVEEQAAMGSWPHSAPRAGAPGAHRHDPAMAPLAAGPLAKNLARVRGERHTNPVPAGHTSDGGTGQTGFLDGGGAGDGGAAAASRGRSASLATQSVASTESYGGSQDSALTELPNLPKRKPKKKPVMPQFLREALAQSRAASAAPPTASVSLAVPERVETHALEPAKSPVADPGSLAEAAAAAARARSASPGLDITVFPRVASTAGSDVSVPPRAATPDEEFFDADSRSQSQVNFTPPALVGGTSASVTASPGSRMPAAAARNAPQQQSFHFAGPVQAAGGAMATTLAAGEPPVGASVADRVRWFARSGAGAAPSAAGPPISGSRSSTPPVVRISQGMHLVPVEALPAWAASPRSGGGAAAPRSAPTSPLPNPMVGVGVAPRPVPSPTGTAPGAPVAPRASPRDAGCIVVEDSAYHSGRQVQGTGPDVPRLQPGSPFDTGGRRLVVAPELLVAQPPLTVPGITAAGARMPSAATTPRDRSPEGSAPSPVPAKPFTGVVVQGGMVIKMRSPGETRDWAPPGVGAAAIERQRSLSPQPALSPRRTETTQPVSDRTISAEPSSEHGAGAAGAQRTGHPRSPLEASFDTLLVAALPHAPPSHVPGVSPVRGAAGPVARRPPPPPSAAKQTAGRGPPPPPPSGATKQAASRGTPPPPPPPGPPPPPPTLSPAVQAAVPRKAQTACPDDDARNPSANGSVASTTSVPSVSAYNSLVDSIKALGESGAHRSHLRSLSKSTAKRGVKGQQGAGATTGGPGGLAAAAATVASARKAQPAGVGTAGGPRGVEGAAVPSTAPPAVRAGAAVGGNDSEGSSKSRSSQGASTLSMREERIAQYRGSVQAIEFMQRLKQAMQPQPGAAEDDDDDDDDGWTR